MKKTKLTRSLLAACSIVALSAVMYGCTGDGSKNDLIATQEALDQEREAHAATMAELDTANSDLMTANGEVTSLTGELGTANGNVTRLEGELMTAQGEVTRLTGELMTSQGNASDLQTQLTAANDDVTRLTGELGTANGEVTRLTGELADAETDRDTYKEMVAKAETEAGDDERIARAKAIATAIGGNRVTDTRVRDVGGGDAVSQLPFAGDDNDITPGALGVAATRLADGAVKVTLTGPGVDPANLKFTGGEAMADADNPWTSAMLTRDLGGATARKTDDETEDVVVYTDIEAPTAKPITTEPAWGLAAGHVLINTDNMNIGHVMPDVVPDPEGPTDVHGALDTFDGTYRGVPGTYTCLGGDCSVDTDKDGKVTVELAAGATLQFEPGVLTATYNDPDAGYVYFGWWLNKPDDNAAAHMVETFAGGNNAAMAVANVTGAATYMGPAAGKYVTKSYTAGKLTDAQVGHFDATATLTANFGEVAAGDVERNSISGSVTDFEQDGESLGDWEVTLARPAINPDATEGNININGSFNGATDAYFGGAASMGAGEWQGQFYGPDAADDTVAPSTAAGTFDAVVGDSGYVSGAFGAQKQ